MSEPLKISVHVEEKRYQPTQEKTVVPGWDAKTVTPDKGYALSKVTVEGMPEPTESETFTENGTYDVGRIGTAVVDVDFDLQDKTVTPTEQTQMVGADTGYDGLDRVTVNPIPSGYVVPTGSIDITANGTVSVSGKATARVNVPIPPGYVIPSGNVDITANGQGIDVAGKAEVNVNVPQGVFPSGTKVITENVTGEDVTNYAAVDVAVPEPSGTKKISITANGTTTEDVANYADAEITVNTRPPAGTFYQIVSEKVTIGENTISNIAELISYLNTAVGDYNEGEMISYSLSERIEIDYVVWFRTWGTTFPTPNYGIASRWKNGSLSTVNETAGYGAYVPPNTTYTVYIAKGDES